MKIEIIQKGQRKLVPKKHAEILVKLGKASYPAVEALELPPATAETKALTVEPAAKKAAPSKKARVKKTTKHQYKRRDMTATNTETK